MSSVAQVPAASALRGRSLLMLVVLVAGHAMKHVFNAGFFVLLPELKDALRLSNAQVGTLATVRQVTGGLTNVPAGFLSDRYSKYFVRILVISMLCIGVFSFWLGRAPNFLIVLVAASLLSCAITFWHPAAIGALSRVFHDRRGFSIALHGTGGSIGEVTGPLLAGVLLTVAMLSWRSVFQLGLMLAVAVAIAVGVLLRGVQVESQTVTVRQYTNAFGRLIKNPPLLVLFGVAACYSATQSVVGTFLPVYVREDLGQSPGTVAAYLSLAQVVGLGSQPLMGYLGDRLGRKQVLVPALLGLGLTVLFVYFAESGVLFVVALAMMGAFLFAIMALLLATGSDLAPRDVQSTLVSLVFGSGVLFSSIAPYFGGVIADSFNVRSTFLYASAIAFTAAVLATFIRMPKKAA